MIERVEALTDAVAAPRHVAVIMDGNRRWAAANGLPQIEGHRRGMLTLRRIVVAAAKAGIEVLTVYAFSEENWGRSSAEVGTLMDLGATFARREADAFAREGVRVRVIGRRDRVPIALREALTMLETRTADGGTMTLNLAVDYGARTELAAAVRTLAHDVVAGRMMPDDIDEDAIAGRLSTAGMPDPDLLIRTGGDLRLSNFLLYQCAYTELWSTTVPWPQFDARAFSGALASYAQRQRRFGK
ncbi:MAG TPA: polyprenyl diphosphate synthase [Candidatus Lustribacter sp.]|jgi:undecaprenyl diphosphate synthase|nr:polyprenyl diphosphate synthase [Candidatus Lustribacter sp.]